LTLDGQLEVLRRADPQEKQQLTPIFLERVKRDIDTVPEGEQELFFRKMADAGLPRTMPAQPPAQSAPALPPGFSLEADTPQAQPPRAIGFGPDATPPATPAVPSPPPQKAIDPCHASATAEQERPPNGYEFAYDHTVEGHGKLTVNNGNPEDAAVIVTSSTGKPSDRLFYVRARMEATITGIPPGRYRIEFQIGKHWESEDEQFQCALATAIFDREDAFEEQTTATDVETDVEVTLHKVVGGNAKTRPLDPSAFRRRR
jgi:hypothetical protein